MSVLSVGLGRDRARMVCRQRRRGFDRGADCASSGDQTQDRSASRQRRSTTDDEEPKNATNGTHRWPRRPLRLRRRRPRRLLRHRLPVLPPAPVAPPVVVAPPAPIVEKPAFVPPPAPPVVAEAPKELAVKNYPSVRCRPLLEQCPQLRRRPPTDNRPPLRKTITLADRSGAPPQHVPERKVVVPAPKLLIPKPATIQGPNIVREEAPEHVAPLRKPGVRPPAGQGDSPQLRASPCQGRRWCHPG